jgi:hypothetical protein
VQFGVEVAEGCPPEGGCTALFATGHDVPAFGSHGLFPFQSPPPLPYLYS